MKHSIIIFFIFFVLLLTFDVIISTPTENTKINTEDILGIQKCFDGKSSEDKNIKMIIYELNNNSTKDTIFIQYKSVKKIAISINII